MPAAVQADGGRTCDVPLRHWCTGLALCLLFALAGCDRDGAAEPAPNTSATEAPPVAAAAPEPSAVVTPSPSAVPAASPAGAPSPGPSTAAAGLPQRVGFPPGAPVRAGNGVYIVDPQSGAVEGWELPVSAPHGFLPSPAVSISPSGRYISFTEWYEAPPDAQGRRLLRERNPQLFDTQTGAVVFFPNLGSVLPQRDPYRDLVLFSPDESRYAVTAGEELLVVRIADSTVERRFWVGAGGYPDGDHTPRWSPDGESIVIRVRDVSTSDMGRNRLLRLEIGSGEVREVAAGADPGHVRLPADRLRYLVARSDAVEVRAVADDRLQRTITPASVRLPPGMDPAHVRIGLAAVSPDGRRIALNAEPAGPDAGPTAAWLIVVRLDDGATELWVEGSLCTVAWTADGHWLQVEGMRDGRFGGFLVASDGSAVLPGPPYRRLSPVDGGTALAGVTLAGYLHAGRSLTILDVSSGAVRHTIQLEQPPGQPVNYRVVWLADGRIALLPAQGLVQADCFVPPDAPELTIQRPP